MIIVVTKSGREYELKTDQMTCKEITEWTDKFRGLLNDSVGFITLSSEKPGFERRIILAVDSVESLEFVNE